MDIVGPTPHEDGFRMPARFSRHERTYMAWPTVALWALALPTIGACISEGYGFQPKANDVRWVVRSVLWSGSVSPVGTRKTGALDTATEPVEAAEKRYAAEFRDELTGYKLRKATASTKAEKERIDKPKRKRLMTSDTTVAALSDLLREDGKSECPTGKVLVKSAELASWIHGMDAFTSKGSEAERKHWLAAYESGFHIVDRVGRGTVTVPSWAAAITGTIQPEEIAKDAKRLATDGLLQRILKVCPTPQEEVEDDDVEIEGGEEAVRVYSDALHRLINTPEHEQRLLTATEGARAYRVKIRERRVALVEAQAYPLPMLGEIGKYEGTWARLALIYHLFDGAGTGEVSEEAGRWAYNAIVNIIEPHAAYFYTEIMGFEYANQEDMLTIAGWLLTSKKRARIKIREIQRSSGRRNHTSKHVSEIMAMLVARDWADEADRGCWKVNPRIYTDLAARHKQETDRRRAAWRLIEASAKARRENK
jgi:hypothetical protein